MEGPGPPPIPPPPFFPRVVLPDIAAHRRARSVPPASFAEEEDSHVSPKLRKRQSSDSNLRREADQRERLKEADRLPGFGPPPPLPRPPLPKQHGLGERPSAHLPPIFGAKRDPSAPSTPNLNEPGARPQSWRHQEPYQHVEPPAERRRQHVEPPAEPRAWRREQFHQNFEAPSEPPHPMHENHSKDRRSRGSLAAAREASAAERRAAELLGQEKRKREEKQRDERRMDEELRRQRDANQAQEEEDAWERAMRKRLQAERVQMEANKPSDNQWEQACQDDLDARLEADRLRRREEAERQARRAAAAEAKMQEERARKRAEQQAARAAARNASPGADDSAPEGRSPEEERTRRRRRHHQRTTGGDGLRSTPRSAAYMQREFQKSASLKKVSVADAIREAEVAALQQLASVRQLPTKKERQKGFKDVLRAWHPDKNPSNLEVATAVFQRVQLERSQVIGS